MHIVYYVRLPTLHRVFFAHPISKQNYSDQSTWKNCKGMCSPAVMSIRCSLCCTGLQASEGRAWE